MLPGAEIILSTWQGADITGLDYDVIVLSDDPGAKYFNITGKVLNNCNRQLISTQAGLINAHRKYILKFRSDFCMESAEFLKYWEEYPLRKKKYVIFKHKVLIDTMFTRMYSDSTGFITPFHISDFWMFGYAEDVRAYYMETKVLPKSELGNFCFKYPNRLPYNDMSFKYAPEQYYCYSFVKRNFRQIQFDDWTDWNEDLNKIYKKIFFSNFVVLSFEESGIWSDKHADSFLNENNVPGIVNRYYYQTKYKELLDPFYELRPLYRGEGKIRFWWLRARLVSCKKFVLSIYRNLKQIEFELATTSYQVLHSIMHKVGCTTIIIKKQA